MEERIEIHDLDDCAVGDQGGEELNGGSTGLAPAPLQLLLALDAAGSAPRASQVQRANLFHVRKRVLLATLAFALVAPGAAGAAADVERGKLLYETRCQACHDTSVHSRGAHKAKSYAELRKQVLRWSKEAGGKWTKAEIEDVSVYLNQRYYRFACPPAVCSADQVSLARPR